MIHTALPVVFAICGFVLALAWLRDAWRVQPTTGGVAFGLVGAGAVALLVSPPGLGRLAARLGGHRG